MSRASYPLSRTMSLKVLNNLAQLSWYRTVPKKKKEGPEVQKNEAALFGRARVRRFLERQLWGRSSTSRNIGEMRL